MGRLCRVRASSLGAPDGSVGDRGFASLLHVWIDVHKKLVGVVARRSDTASGPPAKPERMEWRRRPNNLIHK